MASECTLCRAKLLHAIHSNGIKYALDREAAPDGEFIIRNGRVEEYKDQTGKRYRRHKCQRGKR